MTIYTATVFNTIVEDGNDCETSLILHQADFNTYHEAQMWASILAPAWGAEFMVVEYHLAEDDDWF